MKKSIVLFLNIACLAFLSQPFCEANSSLETTIQTLLAVAGIATMVTFVAGTAYYCGSYEKPDHKILAEAQKCYQDAHREYYFFLQQQHVIFDQTNEQQLMQLTNYFSAHNVGSYVISLGYTLNNLEKQYDIATERLASMAKKKKYNKEMNRALRDTVYDIKLLLSALNKLHNHIKHHEHYLNAFKFIAQSLKQYKKELKLLSTDSYDSSKRDQKLAVIVMNSKSTKSSYPYLNYVEELDSQIQTLQQSIKRLKSYSDYSTLCTTARELKNSLKTIKNILVVDLVYHEELAQRKQNQLKEEKIRIKQRKAAIEQEQIDAQWRQIRAQEEQTWALLRQTQALNEQNSLNRLEIIGNTINHLFPPKKEACNHLNFILS